MTYYIAQGNWTGAISDNLTPNSNNPGNSQYTIAYSGGNYTNPAPTCSSQNFTASYKCGDDTTTKNINIQNAIGKLANFDCSDLFNKCNNITLALDDTGVLTLRDKAPGDVSANVLWRSTNPSTDTPVADTTCAPEPTNATLSLATKYKDTSITGSGMAYNRSYLNATDFLTPGQYIGSPTGKYRLEFVDNNVTSNSSESDISTWSGSGAWTTIFANDTTIGTNTLTPSTTAPILVRYGSSSNNNWIVSLIPKSTSTTTPAAIISSTIVTATNTIPIILGANPTDPTSGLSIFPVGSKTLASSTTVESGKQWVTVGDSTYNIYFPVGTTYRIITPGTAGAAGTVTSQTTTRAVIKIDITTGSYLQIRIFPSEMKLQVVYNVLGCDTASPMNSQSSKLYSIPWTYRENLGKIAYVNGSGQLQNFASTISSTYSNNYENVFRGGMYSSTAADNLTPDTNTSTDVDDCKTKCNQYNIGSNGQTNSNPICVGFEYELNGKTCRLKGEGILQRGIRYNNPTPSKNYQYYSRIKGPNSSGLDSSCITDSSLIQSITGGEWNRLPSITTQVDGTTKCGAGSINAAERTALLNADISLNNYTGPFSDIINNLSGKYNNLKTSILQAKTDLNTKLGLFNEIKGQSGDLTGEQLIQLDALDEDRSLNRMSQRYRYILWTILAILIIFAVIKLMSYLGISKVSDISKIPAVAAAAAAATEVVSDIKVDTKADNKAA